MHRQIHPQLKSYEGIFTALWSAPYLKLVFSPPTFCPANYSYLAFPYSQVYHFISQRFPGFVWIPASTASWKFSLYSHRGESLAHDFLFPSFIALLECLFSNIWILLFIFFKMGWQIQPVTPSWLEAEVESTSYYSSWQPARYKYSTSATYWTAVSRKSTSMFEMHEDHLLLS